MTMFGERGHLTALSACPEPGAAFAAVPPAVARLRAAVRATGLPAAGAVRGTGAPIDGRLVLDLPSVRLVQFVQPSPGDRALRPPD